MSFKRVLALVLALTMIFSLAMPGSWAFAEEDDGIVAVEDEYNEEGIVEDPVEEVPAVVEETPAEEPAAEEPAAEVIVPDEEPAEEPEETEEEEEELEELLLEDLDTFEAVGADDVVSVNGFGFKTIAEAITFATQYNEPNITLLKATNSDISINASGKTLNITGSYELSGNISVTAGTVSITVAKITGAVTVSGGTLTIENATVNKTMALDGGELVLKNVTSNALASVTANGGKLSIQSGKYANVTGAVGVTGNVTGGTFTSIEKKLLADGATTPDYNTSPEAEYCTGTVTVGDYAGMIKNATTKNREYYEYSSTLFPVAVVETPTSGTVNAPVVYLLRAMGGTVPIESGKQVTVSTAEGYNYAVKLEAGTGADLITEKDAVNKTITYKAIPTGTAVAKVGNISYLTLAEAVEAAKAGDTIKLTADVTLTEGVDVGKAITLDLNGKTITNDESIGTDYLIAVLHGGDLTINDSANGGKISMGVKYCAIKMTKLGGDATKVAKLTVNGGIIEGYSFGITGNGNPGRENTEVIINGGTIRNTKTTADGDDAAIYQPQSGTLTLNGGIITGLTGVEIRSGTLIIPSTSSVQITGTANPASFSGNGNGTTYVGAGIAVAQHTTKKAINVQIAGGEVKGANAFAVVNPQHNTEANVTFAVSGGTFTGIGNNSKAIVVDDTRVSKFVTGGTFSSPVAEEYCANDWHPSKTYVDGKAVYGVTQLNYVYKLFEYATDTDKLGPEFTGYIGEAKPAAIADAIASADSDDVRVFTVVGEPADVVLNLAVGQKVYYLATQSDLFRIVIPSTCERVVPATVPASGVTYVEAVLYGAQTFDETGLKNSYRHTKEEIQQAFEAANEDSLTINVLQATPTDFSSYTLMENAEKRLTVTYPEDAGFDPVVIKAPSTWQLHQQANTYWTGKGIVRLDYDNGSKFFDNIREAAAESVKPNAPWMVILASPTDAEDIYDLATGSNLHTANYSIKDHLRSGTNAIIETPDTLGDTKVYHYTTADSVARIDSTYYHTFADAAAEAFSTNAPKTVHLLSELENGDTFGKENEPIAKEGSLTVAFDEGVEAYPVAGLVKVAENFILATQTDLAGATTFTVTQAVAQYLDGEGTPFKFADLSEAVNAAKANENFVLEILMPNKTYALASDTTLRVRTTSIEGNDAMGKGFKVNTENDALYYIASNTDLTADVTTYEVKAYVAAVKVDTYERKTNPDFTTRLDRVKSLTTPYKTLDEAYKAAVSVYPNTNELVVKTLIMYTDADAGRMMVADRQIRVQTNNHDPKIVARSGYRIVKADIANEPGVQLWHTIKTSAITYVPAELKGTNTDSYNPVDGVKSFTMPKVGANWVVFDAEDTQIAVLTADNATLNLATLTDALEFVAQLPVSFVDADGENAVYDADGNVIGPEYALYGATLTDLPADPVKAGYAFKEWQLNGNAYDFATATVTDRVTLRASWTEPVAQIGNEYFDTFKAAADEAKTILATHSDLTPADVKIKLWRMPTNTDVFPMTNETLVVEKVGTFEGNIATPTGIVKAQNDTYYVTVAASDNTVTFTADRYAAMVTDGTGANHYYKDGAEILTANQQYPMWSFLLLKSNVKVNVPRELTDNSAFENFSMKVIYNGKTGFEIIPADETISVANSEPDANKVITYTLSAYAAYVVTDVITEHQNADFTEYYTTERQTVAATDYYKTMAEAITAARTSNSEYNSTTYPKTVKTIVMLGQYTGNPVAYGGDYLRVQTNGYDPKLLKASADYRLDTATETDLAGNVVTIYHNTPVKAITYVPETLKASNTDCYNTADGILTFTVPEGGQWLVHAQGSDATIKVLVATDSTLDAATLTGAIVLQAQYPVTFVDAIGEDALVDASGNEISTQFVNYNAKADKPADPVKADATFNKWVIGTGTDAFDADGKSAAVTGPVTVKATWFSDTFNIVFDANGGEGTQMAMATALKGSATDLPTATYTKAGHKFVGWARNPDASVTNVYTTELTAEDVNYIQANELDPLTNSATLYAIWQAKPVEYNGEFYDAFYEAVNAALGENATATDIILWASVNDGRVRNLEKTGTLTVRLGSTDIDYNIDAKANDLIQVNTDKNYHIEHSTNAETGVTTFTLGRYVAKLTDGQGTEVKFDIFADDVATTTDAVSTYLAHPEYYAYIEILENVDYTMPYDLWEGKPLPVKFAAKKTFTPVAANDDYSVVALTEAERSAAGIDAGATAAYRVQSNIVEVKYWKEIKQKALTQGEFEWVLAQGTANEEMSGTMYFETLQSAVDWIREQRGTFVGEDKQFVEEDVYDTPVGAVYGKRVRVEIKLNQSDDTLKLVAEDETYTVTLADGVTAKVNLDNTDPNFVKDHVVVTTSEDQTFTYTAIRVNNVPVRFVNQTASGMDLAATKYEIGSYMATSGTKVINIGDPLDPIDEWNKEHNPYSYPGYRFDKWYKDAEMSVAFDFDNETVPSEGLTVYGRFLKDTYTLTLDFDGGTADSWTLGTSIDFTMDSAPIQLPVLTNPDPAFTHDGWKVVDEDGNETIYDSKSGFDVNAIYMNPVNDYFRKNMTWTALWQGEQVNIVFVDGSKVLYRVTANAGDKVNDIANLRTVVASPTTLADVIGNYPEGKDLIESRLWQGVDATTELTTDDSVFYLNWLDVHNVTFYYDVIELSTVEVTDGEKLAESQIPAIRKSGETAVWHKGSAEGDVFDVLNDKVTSDLELYATLAEQREVTFVNGDEQTVKKVVVGETVDKPADPVPAEGYDFVDWFVGDAKFDFETPITEDITLTAKFAMNADHFKGIKYAASAQLTESINLNFKMSNIPTDTDKNDYTLVVTVNGVETPNVFMDNGTNALRAIANRAYAYQMNDSVDMRVYYTGLDEPMLLKEVKGYSLRQYFENRYAANNTSELEKAAFKAALDYGAAAQIYFDHEANNLANATVNPQNVLPEVQKPEQKASREGTIDGITSFKASLLFDSQIIVRFKVNAANIDDYEIKINGSAEGFTVSKEPVNGYYEIDKAGLTPLELDDMVEFTITKGRESVTLKYSPYVYAANKWASTYRDGAEANLVKAMVIFGDAVATWQAPAPVPAP